MMSNDNGFFFFLSLLISSYLEVGTVFILLPIREGWFKCSPVVTWRAHLMASHYRKVPPTPLPHPRLGGGVEVALSLYRMVPLI